VAVPLTWSISKEQGALVSQPNRPTTQVPLIPAVLNMGTRLGKVVKGMAYALGDIPVTVKMRAGVKDNFPTAHKLFPKAHAWGAGAVAVSSEEGLRTVFVLIFRTSCMAEVDSSATHAKPTGHTSSDVLASSGSLKKRGGYLGCHSGGMVIVIPGSNTTSVREQAASMVS
jgi:hypothetical protein